MKKLLIFAFFGWSTVSLAQEIIVEKIPLANGEIKIPGELTFPKTEEKMPLVIFVHGSGNVDRNGNQHPMIKANYIKQLADSLNHKGIAFYRYDKRTSVKENLPKLGDIRFEDFVSDVQKAITHFKNDSRFSGIQLIGHSQGSLVSILAINADVKSIVSLAGPGEPIGKTMLRQLQAQNADLAKVAEAHLLELKETDTIQQVNPFLMQLFAPKNQKFIKSWMVYNPSVEIKKLKKPVLIVQGEMDSQVSLTDANLLLSACSTVNQGFGASSKLVSIKDMNHVLKTVKTKTENQASYFDADFPLSSQLVQELVQFIHTNG